MNKFLALLIFLAGCTAHTSVYGPDGKPRFVTNANCSSFKLGADGSLAMVGVDHSTPQKAIAETITSRANGVSALVTALGTAAILK